MSKGKIAAAGVTGAAALALAAGTGATAATLISSKQIKDNTIQSRDIRDGTIQSVDVRNGTVGLRDLGSTVKRSLAGGHIPAGVTVTGLAHWEFPSSEEGEFEFAVNMPGDAGKNLSPLDVNFAASEGFPGVAADADPACTGTYLAPTAPPGKVCLYLNDVSLDIPFVAGSARNGGTRSAFLVQWLDMATGTEGGNFTRVDASWAYTAP